MSSQLQHKILNFEVSPPAESWEIIASRIDQEFDSADHLLADKLEQATVTPPFQAWENIAAELNPQAEILQPEAKPARIIVFNTRRIAAAIAILLAVASITYFILPRSGNNAELAETGNPNNSKTALKNENTDLMPPRVDIVRKSSVGSTMLGRIASRYQSKNQESDLYQQASYNGETADANISYANPDRLPRADAETKISIPTKPITDSEGNIIMDENLVTTPNTHYITVTGPNGEQTKISRKFLRALSYMNDAGNPEDTDIIIHESSLWKWMFQEWRNKLLKEPSFIPSSTNFLDILELKELLNDNF